MTKNFLKEHLADIKRLSVDFIVALIVMLIVFLIGSMVFDWIYFEPFSICTASVVYAFLRLRDYKAKQVKGS